MADQITRHVIAKHTADPDHDIVAEQVKIREAVAATDEAVRHMADLLDRVTFGPISPVPGRYEALCELGQLAHNLNLLGLLVGMHVQLCEQAEKDEVG